jgi:vacuolar-type H+-ATPase subunit F/Vma7
MRKFGSLSDRFDGGYSSQMAHDLANTRVAIIADKYLATGFKLAGVAAYSAGDAREATTTFERIVTEDKYDVIIVTERLSAVLKKQREAILARGSAKPVVAVVPDFGGPTGERLRELHTLISQSIGAELKFKS